MVTTKTQTEIYEKHYGGILRTALFRRGRYRRLRWWFDIGIRHRCRRLKEVLWDLDEGFAGHTVLEIGFGCGHLLASLPKAYALTGVEVSQSAVDAATDDPLFEHRSASFLAVREGEIDDIPMGPFDMTIMAHVLEHIPDDVGFLEAIHDRLADNGLLVLFSPIDEPRSAPAHQHKYSDECLTCRIEQAGFEVLHHEGGLHITGHFWKLLCLPNRRWPWWHPIADSVRLITLSVIPYSVNRLIDKALGRLGVAHTQSMLICRKTAVGVGVE